MNTASPSIPRVDVPLQTLIDLGIEHNLTPDNYFTLWDIIADWQLETLASLGMKPEHHLLDIGCGAMRLGLSASQYLNDGNYCGIDPYTSYIELGLALARASGIKKSFHLLNRGDFDFGAFGQKFDFAMAQSVFTHLSVEQIEACMQALKLVMNPRGKFVFTYTIGSYPTMGFMYSGTEVMERPWMDNIEILRGIGNRHGAKLEEVKISHPTAQSVGLFQY